MINVFLLNLSCFWSADLYDSKRSIGRLSVLINTLEQF